MHNYQFPKITFSSKAKDLKQCSIFFLNDKLKPFVKPSKVLDSIIQKFIKENPKPNELKSFILGDDTFILSVLPNDNPEKAIVNAVSFASKSMNEIYVSLGDIVVNDKLLVAETMLTLKHNWSLKTNKEEFKRKSVIFSTSHSYNVTNGKALAKAQAFVQELVNMPSNMLTPVLYYQKVKEFLKKNNLSKKISFVAHDEKFIKKNKMGAFLAVAKGSVEKPYLFELVYKPNNTKPLVLVGKGITFDSGGISIKPSTGMDAMKGDMAGSAAAIGSIIYAALVSSDVPVAVIAPVCENMPSHKAVKPGDVVKASNGLTIEVLDTDAEGRLVLADALHYSKKYNAKYTIDMATLTGACVVALGSIHSGMFTESEELAEIINKSSSLSRDKVWRMPIGNEHEDMLDSKIADISNLCLGKGAGASNGAIFLKRFAPESNWCHLDIAGTATPKGVPSSGRPVPLISQLIDLL